MEIIWITAKSHSAMARGTSVLTPTTNCHTKTSHHLMLMMDRGGIPVLSVLTAFLKSQRDPGHVDKGWSAMMVLSTANDICLQH